MGSQTGQLQVRFRHVAQNRYRTGGDCDVHRAMVVVVTEAPPGARAGRGSLGLRAENGFHPAPAPGVA